MNHLLQLQQNKTALIADAEAILAKAAAEGRGLTADEQTNYDGKVAQVQSINSTIDRMQSLAALGASAAPVPVRTGARIEVRDNHLDKPFGPEARTGESDRERKERLAFGFGEQLQAVRASAIDPSRTDPRLWEIQQRAAAGASEAVPADGGFLVAPEFSSEILTIAHDTGVVFTKGRKLPLSDATNALKIPGIDETSRADGSRWGGVRMYWQNEADSTTATKPKFRMVELVTKKLMGLYYATDELLNDARALGSIVVQAFGEEVGFKMDDAAIRGTGAGQPQGVTISNAKVAVAAESGQDSGTIIWDNVKKMTAQCHPRSFARSEWYVNINCLPQLMSMSQPVGTAGVPVWLPPGGASASPYGTLVGRPLNVVEQAETVGTEGDIMLLDMSQWVYVDKGSPQSAVSMHVRFLTDEQTFRWVYRVDGQSLWHNSLLPFKGAARLSPFVTLAAR